MNIEYRYNPFIMKLFIWIGVVMLITFIIIFIIKGQFVGFMFIPVFFAGLLLNYTVLKICENHIEIKVSVSSNVQSIKYSDIKKIVNDNNKTLKIFTKDMEQIKLQLYTISKEKREEIINILNRKLI